jgi:hypothetical protein
MANSVNLGSFDFFLGDINAQARIDQVSEPRSIFSSSGITPS